MKVLEKIDRFLGFTEPLLEGKPVGGKDDGALKFVFKLPKEGSFTAEFLDGSKATVTVEKGDKSSGKYAFVGKDNGRIFQTWDSKPSREAAGKVLRRIKFHGTKSESKDLVEETEYQKFFKKKMKEWGISSPDELSKKERKKFFNEVELEWTGEKGD